MTGFSLVHGTSDKCSLVLQPSGAVMF